MIVRRRAWVGMAMMSMLAGAVAAQQGRGTATASTPAPRTDANSKLAHEQLIEKARRGGIDLYFSGDSITRRWGATDYPEFLAHWRRSFHGWNAANFGWGGDTTQNILWRLENGELDGVNPKVIVLLAGTNNVGNATPRDGNDRAADIAGGVRAIVQTMRARAPKATVIVMGVFPRNDNMAVMPTIDRINRSLSEIADGRSVRFLNINDRLADANGRLRDGVSGDGLHLAVAGYQIWADALKPLLTELLGPPSEEDHAPPPTGDPSAAARRRP
jgi:lysophospholipase L1-like esterase